jgi:hypothetical protein
MATTNSCEGTANGRACDGTNTAQHDLEANALIERRTHAYRCAKQNENDKKGFTHMSLLKTQGTRQF